MSQYSVIVAVFSGKVFPFLSTLWFSTAVLLIFPGLALSGSLDKVGTQWAPYMEWSLENSTYSGNPFDLQATATFVHRESGETHTTQMFYDGGATWRFRFTGTRHGSWTVTTASNDADLQGHTGNITVSPNTDPDILGFVTNIGKTWAREVDGEGKLQPFIPQLVMVNGPQGYYNNPAAIDDDINRFIVGHGFNGFHMLVTCRWAELEEQKCRQVSNPEPDPRTFKALEQVISRVHAAGGIVHLWAWGDESRGWTPTVWGINGVEDRRIQRYIAARLGPLPGWTMGYGFDNWEWVTESELREWHANMHDLLGWKHLLGARATKNTLDQMYEGLDYSGYEQHRPDYQKYVETIEKRVGKPSFSEDRFRVRQGGHDYKDYTHEMVRRGLWHSAMAGGVANIWGELSENKGANGGTDSSGPFPHPEWIKTNALFFKTRFHQNLTRCNGLTDGLCLKQPNNSTYLFYKEDTKSLAIDLSKMDRARQAVAVDTKLPYQEIELGSLQPEQQTWSAPYISDWAIAVGTVGSDSWTPPPWSGNNLFAPGPVLYILLNQEPSPR